MSLEQIELFDFGFKSYRVYAFRDAEIAFRVANGEKLQSIANDYRLSKATITNAYKRTARSIYRKIINSGSYERFTQEERADLYHSQFKTPLGLALIKNFLSRHEKPPEINFLDDQSEKEIKRSESVVRKVDTMAHRINGHRKVLIEKINKDFDLMDKWINEIKQEITRNFPESENIE